MQSLHIESTNTTIYHEKNRTEYPQDAHALHLVALLYTKVVLIQPLGERRLIFYDFVLGNTCTEKVSKAGEASKKVTRGNKSHLGKKTNDSERQTYNSSRGTNLMCAVPLVFWSPGVKEQTERVRENAATIYRDEECVLHCRCRIKPPKSQLNWMFATDPSHPSDMSSARKLMAAVPSSRSPTFTATKQNLPSSANSDFRSNPSRVQNQVRAVNLIHRNQASLLPNKSFYRVLSKSRQWMLTLLAALHHLCKTCRNGSHSLHTIHPCSKAAKRCRIGSLSASAEQKGKGTEQKKYCSIYGAYGRAAPWVVGSARGRISGERLRRRMLRCVHGDEWACDCESATQSIDGWALDWAEIQTSWAPGLSSLE